MRVAVILECTLGFLLFVLVIIPMFKELRAMYAVTKQFQLNRYMKLFVREGIMYFFVWVSLLSWCLFAYPLHSCSPSTSLHSLQAAPHETSH